MIRLESSSEGTIVPVRAHAGARRTGLRNLYDGALRIDVTAAPEKGKANQAIVALLSDLFELPKSAIQLVGGASSPRKKFLFYGLSEKQVHERVTRLLNDAAS